MALRHYDWGNPFKTLTKVVPCASAALIDEYKPPTGPDKPVDYCLCIDPKYVGHGVPPPGIETLRSHLPLSSINVISEAGLFGRPIAVPIKTKSPREGLDNAVSQLSMWLAAHLGLLDQLVDYGNLTLDEEPNDSGLTLEDIGFFPGLIVQGHDWHFVAANREGPKTVIWSKVFLGSTSDIVGIYQIVAALQILRDWTEKVYWPWLQRVVWRAVRYFRRD